MSCPFSQYKNIFGKAGEGAHSIRLFGEPVVDWTVTLIAVVFISWKFKIPFELVLVLALLVGILFHWMFGVPTSTLKYLGINC